MPVLIVSFSFGLSALSHRFFNLIEFQHKNKLKVQIQDQHVQGMVQNLSNDISTLGSTVLSFPTDAGVISKPWVMGINQCRLDVNKTHQIKVSHLIVDLISTTPEPFNDSKQSAATSLTPGQGSSSFLLSLPLLLLVQPPLVVLRQAAL